MPRNPNPPPPGKGRPKGSPNKITQDMRETVRTAFEMAGGVDYLVQQSQANPVAFMGLVGKIIPQEVKAAVDGKLVISWQT